MKLASLAAFTPRPSTGDDPASQQEGTELYLPAEDGMPECLGFVPPTPAETRAPRIAVCVHGISRDHREQIALLRHEAGRRGFALLAPRFGERTWPDYQRLGRRGRGPRADLAVELAVERLEARLGLRFRDRFMIGYSGGAQFVHRYAMAHPDRVRAAVCAAAGWYTFPDANRRYPYGLRVEGSLAGVRLEPEAFLRVPMLVAVGRLDTTPEAMRSGPRLDAEQGNDRLERAERWADAMRRAAARRRLEPPVELAFIEGAGHAFSECVAGGLARLAFDFFEEARGTH